MTDGKQLESLVAFVEKTMLPKGFAVETNQRVYNDEGVQIAEFDVEIRGRLGTTDLAWLIECRDRPGSGPAPGSWIEQLVGRRSRFGFNKVTAVSTTGFAEGARDFARQQGIELRNVEALIPEAFSWLSLSHVSFVERKANLESARLLVNENTSEEMRTALLEVVTAATGTDRILSSTSKGTHHTMAEAFLGAVEIAKLLEDLEPGNPSRRVKIHAQYPNDHDHFVVETAAGEVRLEAIAFEGELTASETLVPVDLASKYHNVETGETISQVAAFAPQDIGGNRMALEVHRMGENGETYIILRSAEGDA
jgi:hypothetical protein